MFKLIYINKFGCKQMLVHNFMNIDLIIYVSINLFGLLFCLVVTQVFFWIN